MAALLLQVLVYHDLLGMMQHPHHAKVTPKFCKQYAAVGQVCPVPGKPSIGGQTPLEVRHQLMRFSRYCLTCLRPA